MYTRAALIDIHDRAHTSLGKVLDHVGTLPAEDLTRPLEGFSYPTLVSQLHHAIAAERYWMSVLRGSVLLDDDADAHEDIAALQSLRRAVYEDTHDLLEGLTDDDASAPRSVTNWKGDPIRVVPAHVLLRTQTHLFQHHGEIATMIRQLGHTFPPMLDFPLA